MLGRCCCCCSSLTRLRRRRQAAADRDRHETSSSRCSCHMSLSAHEHLREHTETITLAQTLYSACSKHQIRRNRKYINKLPQLADPCESLSVHKNPPQKYPRLWGGIWARPHLYVASRALKVCSPKTTSRSVQPFLQRSSVFQRHTHTHRQTTECTTCRNRPHLCYT